MSKDLLESVTFRVQDTSFQQISVVDKERSIVVSHSLKLGLCGSYQQNVPILQVEGCRQVHVERFCQCDACCPFENS